MIRGILQVLKSKTVWTAVSIAAFTTFNEDLQDWIATHTSAAAHVVAFVMIFLRVLTFGPLVGKKNVLDK